MRINALVCAAALSVFVSGGAYAFDAAAPDEFERRSGDEAACRPRLG